LEKVNILGVEVACLDLQAILDLVCEWSEHNTQAPLGTKYTILYVNAHCLNTACADEGYRRVLNQADLVYSDGISVVWASRLLGGCELHKMTGADWIDDFASWAASTARSGASGLRIYILAGQPGIAERAGENLMKKYPGLQIVGACDGYFRQMSEAQVLQDIAGKKPHVLFVGMGIPQQEKWLAAHRQDIPTQICWAVGALFDYVAGVEPRVPRWMNALALEWLWRLMIDPVGKWRRYIFGNPLFAWHILRQKLSQR
jgi:N-acetylglucosaminyldiphosphoundecaprenol N-acetyl-beta-D-mannosaminyltransferase